MLLEHAAIAPDLGVSIQSSARLDTFLARLRRLTPREVRLLILVVQDGLSHREITEVLGISRGNVATTTQSIRRKLAVPRLQDLGTFVRGNETLATALLDEHPKTPTADPRQSEQRHKDLLRATVDELKAVATRARRRAAALERLPRHDHQTAAFSHDETQRLHQVADIADIAATHALALVRRDWN